MLHGIHGGYSGFNFREFRNRKEPDITETWNDLDAERAIDSLTRDGWFMRAVGAARNDARRIDD
jgi:hypothetical protein